MKKQSSDQLETRLLAKALPAPMSWDNFVKDLKKLIKDYTIPYVTELSLHSVEDTNSRAFKVLISTIISLRTKDQVTAQASLRLFKKADTPEKLSRLHPQDIEKLIYPAGFYRVKAKSIKEVSGIIEKDYNGKVPADIEKLTDLPGVGRKTANLVLTEGFDMYGICVDTHVHRILNRFGFIKTKNPDETEQVLRLILPKKYWKQINFWLVTFGQNHCKPVRPKCDKCTLTEFCGYYKQKKKLK